LKVVHVFRAAVIATFALGGCQLIAGIDDIELLRETPCASTDDCASGQVCLFSACRTACRADTDCASGQECLDTDVGSGCVSAAQASCTAPGGCPAGTTCVGAQCRTECATDGDCRSDQRCQNGGCAPRSGGAGGAGGDPDASAGAGGSTTGGAGGAPSDAGGAGGDGGIVVIPCDPEERPDDNSGIFVSPSGSDGASGTRQAPFQTIGKAIDAAKGAGRSVIYLAPGGYIESVVLENLGSGLTIRGGWALDGTRWVRDCTDGSRRETEITQPATAPLGSAVVTLRGELGTTRLRSLTIQNKLQPAPAATGEDGENMTGIYVEPSAAGAFHLLDVAVQASRGGDGGVGLPPGDGTPDTCDGATGCADGAEGQSGVEGATPDNGQFTPAGFLPGRGGEATPGTYGAHGYPGGAGQTIACSFCYDPSINWCLSSGIVTASQGRCGCGGPSGDTGKPGGGGGASVGVLVASADVSIGIGESVIEAKAGGSGGPGATAGVGAEGAAGSVGPSASCWQCNNANCAESLATATGGSPGGTGGPGGESGKGGDGAGGPSHALVLVAPANVTLIDSDLRFAAGGQSPSGAAAPASARHEQPACGNGVLEPGEECDDANRIDDDACSNACRLNCDGDGEFVDPSTGTCYRALPALRTAAGARSLSQNYGPGWDIMVPSTDASLAYLRTRLPLPAAALFVGLKSEVDEDSGGLVWASVSGHPVAPAITAPASPDVCASIGQTGAITPRVCALSLSVLCERRVDQFQTADCGNGVLDRFEECDDGNLEPGDGCSPECLWDCSVNGTAGVISVAERSCYVRLAAPATPTFEDAQTACSELGGGWRMVKLENRQEFSSINALSGIGAAAYWLGASNARALDDGGIGLGPWRWEDQTTLNTTSTWPELDGAPAGSCMQRSAANVTFAQCAVAFSGAPVCEFDLR
jgi:cysteine-rich repeat protein